MLGKNAPLLLLIIGCLTTPIIADDMGELKPATKNESQTTSDESLVQIALLLDTSGSMKGLVNQARCQLWNVVSELSNASRNQQPAKLEIAIYQYGTEDVSKRRGCLRQVIAFTDDLDEVSRALFSLKIGLLYHHVHDDLVDAMSHDVVKLDAMPEEKMPTELRAMSANERKAFMQGKIDERNRVRREMAAVISQRQAFLERKMSEELLDQGEQPTVLGDALTQTVRSQAERLGFKFDTAKTIAAAESDRP